MLLVLFVPLVPLISLMSSLNFLFLLLLLGVFAVAEASPLLSTSVDEVTDDMTVPGGEIVAEFPQMGFCFCCFRVSTEIKSIMDFFFFFIEGLGRATLGGSDLGGGLDVIERPRSFWLLPSSFSSSSLSLSLSSSDSDKDDSDSDVDSESESDEETSPFNGRDADGSK